MDYVTEWKGIKRKITAISILELVFLVVAFSFSQQFDGKLASYLGQVVLPATLMLHGLVLYKLWRCPHCSKRFKFWQRFHRESVSSLSGCFGCGAKFK